MSSQSTRPVQLDVPAFLMKDYELKINYFTNHLSRMWTRFGMFVTLESALVAATILARVMTGPFAAAPGPREGPGVDQSV